jgi:predicted GH43/DUF377 family glycosyl hydrolase
MYQAKEDYRIKHYWLEDGCYHCAQMENNTLLHREENGHYHDVPLAAFNASLHYCKTSLCCYCRISHHYGITS